VIGFEIEVFLILQVNMLLWENHSYLSVRKLSLTLVFLWHVLRHRTDLASSRWLLAANNRNVLIGEKFVNQLCTVVRAILLSRLKDSGWYDGHG